METVIDQLSAVTLLLLELSGQPEEAEFYEAFNVLEFLAMLVIIVLGLLFSGLFSGSEVAFFSLGGQYTDTSELYSDGQDDPKLNRITYLIERPRRLLATILIGNTFANIITAVSAALATGMVAVFIGLPEFTVFAIEVIVLTFTIVILSEITPKILALKDPITFCKKISGFIYFFFVVLGPLATFISKTTLLLERHFPRQPDRISSEDIKTIAEVGEMQGSLYGDEREIIENVIEFGNTTVREIMTSRVDIVAISAEDTLESALKLIQEKSYSRMPLYENDLDNIIGIVHTKDLLPYLESSMNEATINWRIQARRAPFIPATKKLDDLLEDFQREKTHMAIVVDEYGGTEGLVTLDDVLEEIIGEISDENTEQVSLFTRRKNGVYIFDASIDLDDMAEILNRELTTDQDEYETLGGLVYHLTERIPEVGEKVVFNDLELTVHEVDKNRITKVMVRPVKSSGDTQGEDKDHVRPEQEHPDDPVKKENEKTERKRNSDD